MDLTQAINNLSQLDLKTANLQEKKLQEQDDSKKLVIF